MEEGLSHAYSQSPVNYLKNINQPTISAIKLYAERNGYKMTNKRYNIIHVHFVTEADDFLIQRRPIKTNKFDFLNK